MLAYTIAGFVLCIASAYVVAAGVWPLLKRGGRINLFGTGLAILGISVSPALIPPDSTMVRGIACLLCIDPLFRVVDYSRQARRGQIRELSWRDYLGFLVPFPFLLTVYGEKQKVKQPPHDRGANFVRLVIYLSISLAALVLCLLAEHYPMLRESFVLDHLMKMLLFTIVVEAASQVQVAWERLYGYHAAPIINHAYLAATPADFWFKYNQRVRQWLYADVFVPCGGRRSPMAGVVMVFLVSAIFHEYFFALATSRLDGYQFAFFMLQVPAVLLSQPLERRLGRGFGGRAVAHGLTIVWFTATSPLFFHGLDRVFPFFYASTPWLP